jgi:glycosyltransferase involved in cell wall biosynthesis
MNSLSATVVITTKNRKEELAAAIESALTQTALPQVLVIDDGSTDGTAEMVRQRFPLILFDRTEQSRGYIVQRNRAAQMAGGEIIVSIDDDAVFSSPNTIEQTLAEFDRPLVGAVTIPLIDVKQSPQVHQRAHRDGAIDVAYTFIGTAHAVRRDLFLRLGGYREFLFHQTEEIDFTVRMLAAGFIVRMGRADPIHHFESPRRDFRRIDLYSRRNDVLYAWHNVPMPYLPIHLLGTTFNGLRLGWRHGRPWSMIRGLLNGYAAIFQRLGDRKPVSRKIYRLSRRLQRSIWLPLEEVQPMLDDPQES